MRPETETGRKEINVFFDRSATNFANHGLQSGETICGIAYIGITKFVAVRYRPKADIKFIALRTFSKLFDHVEIIMV